MLILVYDSSQQLVSQSKIIKDYLHIILLCLRRQVESKNTLNKKGKVKGKTMTIAPKGKLVLTITSVNEEVPESGGPPIFHGAFYYILI